MSALTDHVADLNATPLKTFDDVALVQLIRADWTNVYFGAVPYLDALEDLAYSGKGIGAAYYADAPGSVPLYFLSNAASWKGETARAVKAELKRRVK